MGGSIQMSGVSVPVRSSPIVTPLSEDGLFGFDQYGQLMVGRVSRDGYTSYTFVVDVRDKKCEICQRGWDLNAESMGDQVEWRLIGQMVHLSCLVRHDSFNQRAEVSGALYEAGIRHKGLKPIPNEYWRNDDFWGKQPWYRADLVEHLGVYFVIGHRKRVWSIEVKSDVKVQHPIPWWGAAKLAFDSENVTKEFGTHGILVHAWSIEKMRDYVKRLAEAGQLCARPDDESEPKKLAD